MSSISSADGAYTIQLGDPIQEPLTKHLGTKVGVYHGILLKKPGPVDLEAEAAKKLGHLSSFLPQHETPGCGKLSPWHSQSPRRHFWQAPDPIPESDGVQGDGEAAMPLEIVVKVFSVLVPGHCHADHEVAALKALTAKKCQYSPTYFGDFVLGSDHYVLMSKLPGVSLDKSESWRYDEKNVRAAFERAIKAVHDCGIASRSTNRRNVLWDEVQGKCYIVDFERTERNHSETARERWIKRGWESFDHWTAQ